MQLFTVLVTLLVCVSRLDADQSTTTVTVPPKSKVCFSFRANFRSDSNQFEAAVTSMSLFMLNDSTLSSALDRQDKCSVPRTNKIDVCVESELIRMKANLIIEATCTQKHNTAGNDEISKATTLTLVKAMEISGYLYSIDYKSQSALTTYYRLTCRTKDGGNTLDGIELFPYMGSLDK